MTNHDAELLRRFARSDDEAAFYELVARNFNLVYSVALRQLNGDAHLAKDIAQTVFTDLARKARILSRRTMLVGWLYEATRRAAAKTVRGEQRRRIREQEAYTLNDMESSRDWEHILPMLDSAMGHLSSKDRTAVVLHFFGEKGFGEVGASIGVGADAAQKRVARALPKLRNILLRRGVTISLSTLASMLATSAAQSAPIGLASSVSNASLASAAAAPAGLWMLLSEVLTAKVGIAGVAVALLLVGAVSMRYPAYFSSDERFLTLDLSQHYNGDLRDSWTPVEANNHLQSLPRGRHKFNDVLFEVRGVIQLQGELWKERRFQLPERVESIPVHSTGSSVHLLHADAGCASPPGAVVASLALNYSDGQRTELPIRHGIHCLDWWEWNTDSPTDTNTMVAWRGQNPAAGDKGIGIRLFQTKFLNPKPTKEIHSIDYVSGMACAAPFMVALTIEFQEP